MVCHFLLPRTEKVWLAQITHLASYKTGLELTLFKVYILIPNTLTTTINFWLHILCSNLSYLAIYKYPFCTYSGDNTLNIVVFKKQFFRFQLGMSLLTLFHLFRKIKCNLITKSFLHWVPRFRFQGSNYHVILSTDNLLIRILWDPWFAEI